MGECVLNLCLVRAVVIPIPGNFDSASTYYFIHRTSHISNLGNTGLEPVTSRM